jgi:hypothetical protein
MAREIDRYAPYSKLPIEGTPPEPLPQYGGADELNGPLNPEYTLTLDAATFMWVWRLLEAKAYQHWSNEHTRKTLPGQVRVALAAAEACRRAHGSVKERLSSIGSTRKTFTRR